MKSEIKNVPKKPIRRWLPANPVRRQKTKYMRTPIVNSIVYMSLLAIIGNEPSTGRAVVGSATHTFEVVAPSLGVPELGGWGAAGCGAVLDREKNFSLCVLMNSR
jgi:hypothetical protein